MRSEQKAEGRAYKRAKRTSKCFIRLKIVWVWENREKYRGQKKKSLTRHWWTCGSLGDRALLKTFEQRVILKNNQLPFQQHLMANGHLRFNMPQNIGKTDVEAETPILWPPDAKSWLIWKDPDAGEDWGQEEKGTTEDEMVGWHHQLNGHGFG